MPQGLFLAAQLKSQSREDGAQKRRYGNRRVLDAASAPAAVDDEGRKEPHHQRNQRWRDSTTRQREHRRTDHEEHQPGGGQRCQARPNVQEPGENQPERPEHLGHANEPYEPARQRYLPCQRLKWKRPFEFPARFRFQLTVSANLWR